MKIAFEGPPAAGKSTLAEECTSLGHVRIVPEVNHLFKRPDPEPVQWYLERQVCRWEIAEKQEEHGNLVILDGDPFQPLWFGWIYSDEKWTSVSQCESFYRKMIRDGRIGFPDLYVFFSLPEDERRKREVCRGKNRGHDDQKVLRKYERYIRLVAPQKLYFEALREEFPDRVRFFQSTTIVEGREFVDSIRSLQSESKRHEQLRILDFLVTWLEKNKGELVSRHNSGQRSTPASA